MPHRSLRGGAFGDLCTSIWDPEALLQSTGATFALQTCVVCGLLPSTPEAAAFHQRGGSLVWEAFVGALGVWSSIPSGWITRSAFLLTV